MGSRLGTVNIGTGRGQEPQDWIQKLACLRLREREDLGSELELEMNPALGFPRPPASSLPSYP